MNQNKSYYQEDAKWYEGRQTEAAIKNIAESYKAAPDELKKLALQEVIQIRKFINHQFNFLSKGIYFDFVNSEPYKYDVCDWLVHDAKTGVLRVNATGNDSAFWEKYHNLQFRAIHDYIHAVHRLDFNLESEITAYKMQMDFSMSFKNEFPFIDWNLYSLILRSEIIYQAYVKTHFKEFHIEQKLILTSL
jgi:hypothetical protein